jgi:hypothetical protein
MISRYLFSPDVSGSLDASLSTLSLAMCCITYLCQSHHDPEIVDDIRENIIRGDYRLHYYSVEMWSKLVEQYLDTVVTATIPLPSQLLGVLRLLLTTRDNASFADATEDSNPKYLETLKDSNGGIRKLLCNEVSFRRKVSSMKYNTANGEHAEIDIFMRSVLFTLM